MDNEDCATKLRRRFESEIKHKYVNFTKDVIEIARWRFFHMKYSYQEFM